MICVDANVTAKWLFEEELTRQAESLYTNTVNSSERIVAPALLAVEMTNIIRQRMRRPKSGQQPLSLPEATRHLEQFLAFPIELVTPSELHQRALELAEAHGLPAVYDAHYLALAQILRCTFWTADKNLINSLQGRLSFVRWIGDYTG